MKKLLIIGILSSLFSGCDMSLSQKEEPLVKKEYYFKIYEDTMMIQQPFNDKVDNRIIMVEEEPESNKFDKNWYIVSIISCNRGWGELTKVNASAQTDKMLFHFGGSAIADSWAERICQIKIDETSH
jgi:hypothetical protein